MIDIIIGLIGLCAGAVFVAVRSIRKANRMEYLSRRARNAAKNANEAAARAYDVSDVNYATNVLHRNGAIRPDVSGH